VRLPGRVAARNHSSLWRTAADGPPVAPTGLGASPLRIARARVVAVVERTTLLAVAQPASMFTTPPAADELEAPRRYSSLLVILPAHDEEEHVGGVVRGVLAALPGADVLVVDDGSRDRTAAEARRSGARVASLPVNLGYGAALQTGYKYAVRRGYELVAQIDADGQHSASDLPRLLHCLEESQADVVIGSRFLDRDGHYKPSAARKLGMSLFARLVSATTRSQVTDSTSGLQVMQGSVARFFCSEIYPQDYPDADILILLLRSGFRVTEVPVRMQLPPDAATLHRGHRSLYYSYKMALSIFVTLLRRNRT
jgi:glycosyltransferase involved in cell wall biosynthesis